MVAFIRWLLVLLVLAAFPLFWMGCGEVSPSAPDIEPGSVLTVDLPDGVQMDLVWIPAGKGVMGSPESEINRFGDEGPQREVTIEPGFYLGMCEVTQAQWQAVMGTRPWTGMAWVADDPYVPAVYLTWYDAQDFVHRLNVAAGDSLYRLPTEEEWEYAARAGTTTRWWFGDNESDLWHHAWYYGNTTEIGEAYPHSVGIKPPNPWGLYDMHGNAREWVQDWYGYYPNNTSPDTPGPPPFTARVVRGGGHGSQIRYTRSATRAWRAPIATDWGFGFRILQQP